MEERLNKYLASNGICSRRSADEIIKQGKVKVNGNIVQTLGTKVNDTDIVEVDNMIVKTVKARIYIALNKPVGYVTTANEQFGRPCVTDIVNVGERIYPVGRLDMYSEGLILLTNDGEFVNRVIHPSHHISKTYEVLLNKEIMDKDISTLITGVDIGGYVTKEAKVIRLSNDLIQITIFEGKNRQIRKMCEMLGYKVKRLRRIKIGKLELGSLKCGKYKILSSREIEKIFE